jgi:cell division protease FtsH
VTTIPYSDFEQYLKEGRISDVVVSSQYLEGTLKPKEGEKAKPGQEVEQPQHVIANRVDPALAERLDRYGVPFSAISDSLYERFRSRSKILAALLRRLDVPRTTGC